MLRRKVDEETKSFYRMMDAYLALKIADPDHELLGLANLDVENEDFTYFDGFRSRCIRDEKGWNIRMHNRYARAMENAAIGRPYKLLDATT